MVIQRLGGASGRRVARGLTRGDVDAAVWPRVKASKAKGTAPNLWEFLVSSQDAKRVGLAELCETCLAAVAAAFEGEGAGCDGLTVVCGCSGAVGVGRVRVTCGDLESRAMSLRKAEAHAAGEEVRTIGDCLAAVCSWDPTPTAIGRLLTIGRDPSCDVVAEAPGVSRRHGQVTADGADRTLYVDRSTNGSVVDGLPVHGSCVPVRAGSRIVVAPGMVVDIVSDTVS